jgi:hypothetical protein
MPQIRNGRRVELPGHTTIFNTVEMGTMADQKSVASLEYIYIYICVCVCVWLKSISILEYQD